MRESSSASSRVLILTLPYLYPSGVLAQLEWKVSVKFFYDQAGNPPPGSCSPWSAIDTEEEVQQKIDYANTILDRTGRGYRFRLTEMIQLNPTPAPPPLKICIAGPTTPDNQAGACVDAVIPPPAENCEGGTWQDFTDWAYTGACRGILQREARANPVPFHFDKDAFNIYILHTCGGGASASRNRLDAEVSLIVIGQGAGGGVVRVFHELGHSLNVCHTHGSGGCTFRCGAPFNDGGCVLPLGDDCLEDTLPDAEGCESPNQIAQMHFGVNYADLTCEDREKVLNVRYNFMSYHADDARTIPCDPVPYVSCTELPPPDVCRHRVTPDQLDLMADRTNTLYRLAIVDPTRELVVNGLTLFTDTNGDDVSGNGNSTEPYLTFARAFQEADAVPGTHIVLLRGGTYSGTLDSRSIVTRPVTLRASRGDAVIGR